MKVPTGGDHDCGHSRSPEARERPAASRAPTRCDSWADGQSPDGRGLRRRSRRPRPSSGVAAVSCRRRRAPRARCPKRGTVRDDEAMERALARSARPPAAAPRRTRGSAASLVARRRDRRRGRDASRPGGAHAEVAALRAAGDRARGATAYVTLEPCAHHGRTPPCADALDRRRRRRASSPRSRIPTRASPARGFARLRAAGIDVDVGVGADAGDARSRAVSAPPAHRPAVRRRQGRDRVSTAGSPPPTARRSGSRPTPRAPTPTSCAPTRRRSSSAPAPRSPTARAHRARRRAAARAPAAARRCSTRAAASRPTGPLFDTDARAHARRHDRARRPRRDRRVARGRRQGRGRRGRRRRRRRRSRRDARAARPRGCAAGARRRRRHAARRACSPAATRSDSSRTSRRSLLGTRGAPALAFAGPDTIADAPRARRSST